ncbi:MAG: hypothetical protein KatS3mg003_1264 [Candidatus Nitrosocaldaceae archaeon]|nr:MAG: hypothetical protein KatS3mg003_0703 [Candidatus Nitrosocaldaceae archaeon]GIU71785.1 MAG: hypothetical protein KatS3mg003_1264 [Candidatus Nitrosocaldaceae archaeon]
MLNNIPRNGDRVFWKYKNVSNLRRTFERQRKKMANKLGNPKILLIHFHTLRHWKATNEYYKTRDIVHVQRNIVGYKDIKNTLKYVQLIKFEEESEYIVKTAKNIDELQVLLEQGFEYVCDHEGYKVLRKRK